MTFEEFVTKAKEIYGDKYTYKQPYINNRTKISIYCTKCCTEFEQIPVNHLRKKIGCGCIRFKSKSEETFAKLLDELCISYMREHTFNGMFSILNKPLRVDFFLPEYNTIVEVNGPLHYEPIEVFGGVNRLIRQKENDLVKVKYAAKNNYHFVELLQESKNYDKAIAFIQSFVFPNKYIRV